MVEIDFSKSKENRLIYIRNRKRMTERERGKERKDMYVCMIKKRQRRKGKQGKRERE